MNSFKRSRVSAWQVLAVGVWVAAVWVRTGLAKDEAAGETAPQKTAVQETAVQETAAPEPVMDCAAELAKLKADYDRLLVDHKNAVAQAKALLIYKNQVRDVEDIRRQNQLKVRQLEREKEAALAEAKELQARLEGLNVDVVKLGQERDEYKNSFEKASVENIIGEDAQKKMDVLKDEKVILEKRTSELEKRVKSLEHEGIKKEAEAELLRRQLEEVKAKYAQAKKDNAVLEKKIQHAPRQAAELARENKVLVKRTALMHYNLGVFYTQNREFERAVLEFEKAVELNPQDAASFFNLGYIYAEQLQNRPKAVDYFRKYLKLAQKDDKDADWVKRYILTWQTWEGDAPIK